MSDFENPDLASDQIGAYNIYPEREKLVLLGYSSSIGFGPDLGNRYLFMLMFVDLF